MQNACVSVQKKQNTRIQRWIQNHEKKKNKKKSTKLQWMINAAGTRRLQYGSRRQNPVPAAARCRCDAGTAAAVTAQPEPARCIASLHFRRLSAAGCAAGGRNCRSRPAGGPLLQCYLGSVLVFPSPPQITAMACMGQVYWY